jgi:hypothetical protein
VAGNLAGNERYGPYVASNCIIQVVLALHIFRYLIGALAIVTGILVTAMMMTL